MPELMVLLRRMVVFLMPLTALVLSEPLLVWCTSLFIGQFGNVAELAALGPANIVIGESLTSDEGSLFCMHAILHLILSPRQSDNLLCCHPACTRRAYSSAFVQYVFVSIQIATMGLLGEQLRNNDGTAAQRLLSSSLGLAALCGAMACVAMIAFPEPLVMLTGVRDAEVVSSAKSLIVTHRRDLRTI